ncbi:MAG: hypothetical protein NW224_02005 [Leptolyngbyaceae cyanobacterium bins.302]|nr:hypothetical protein [Leptolyngbyaceae cyanobacterium bins.302]
MTQPILSVDLEGQKLILRLYKSSGTSFVVEKNLNQRSKPGLESDLSRNDLDRFKETVGSVSVVLQLPQ